MVAEKVFDTISGFITELSEACYNAYKVQLGGGGFKSLDAIFNSSMRVGVSKLSLT